MAFLKFLGHSAFEISIAGRRVFLDPWLQTKTEHGERLVPPAFTQEKVREADLILLTHEHFDHCDAFDVEMIVGRTNAQVIAPENALALLPIPAKNKIPVSEGERFTIMGVDVEVTPARHPQSTYSVGFVVGGEGKSVYHAGDTYDFYDMSQIQVDVALLPIGGTYTMDVIGAITALKTMRAKKVVPMHYNTFSRICVDVNDFARRVRASTQSEPVVLRVGEEMGF